MKASEFTKVFPAFRNGPESLLKELLTVRGLVVLSLLFIEPPQSPWAYLGVIPLATGLFGWCPPYVLFGFSTCKSCK